MLRFPDKFLQFILGYNSLDCYCNIFIFIDIMYCTDTTLKISKFNIMFNLDVVVLISATIWSSSEIRNKLVLIRFSD